MKSIYLFLWLASVTVIIGSGIITEPVCPVIDSKYVSECASTCFLEGVVSYAEIIGLRNSIFVRLIANLLGGLVNLISPVIPDELIDFSCYQKIDLPEVPIGCDESSIKLQYTTNSNREGLIVHITDLSMLDRTDIRTYSRVIVIIHGWTNDINSPCPVTLRKKLLEQTDTAVISVDIKECLSSLTYVVAANNVPIAGKAISEVLYYLISVLKVLDLIVIGHSMGCHVSGFAGRFLESNHGIQLKVIIGLDCAGPVFKNIPELRMKCSDAKCIISLHTSYTFGTGELFVGTHNIRLNRGGHQKACEDQEILGLECFQPDLVLTAACCSHAFGCNVTAEMLTISEGSNQFYLTECESYRFCNTPTDIVFGLDICDHPEGIYDLRTSPSSPFGMGTAGLVNCMTCEDCYSCFGCPSQLMAASFDGNVCYKPCGST